MGSSHWNWLLWVSCIGCLAESTSRIRGVVHSWITERGWGHLALSAAGSVSHVSHQTGKPIWTHSHGPRLCHHPRQEVFFVDGLRANSELDFLSGTSDGGNMWKCRTDRYSMIRYQYGTMCAEFRGSSASSHLHHLASAGCTDIFVHSHHCVGGVSFPRVASGHHFQHICRVKNTWLEANCVHPFSCLLLLHFLC